MKEDFLICNTFILSVFTVVCSQARGALEIRKIQRRSHMNKTPEKHRKVLVYLASGNVGLVFARWDCDGGSWLGAQPAVVSSSWQPLSKRPHSRLAMQSPWQPLPVGAVRQGDRDSLFICLCVATTICMYVLSFLDSVEISHVTNTWCQISVQRCVCFLSLSTDCCAKNCSGPCSSSVHFICTRAYY